MGKELDKTGERGVVTWGQFGKVKWETALQESSSKMCMSLGIGAGGISTKGDLSCSRT